MSKSRMRSVGVLRCVAWLLAAACTAETAPAPIATTSDAEAFARWKDAQLELPDGRFIVDGDVAVSADALGEYFARRHGVASGLMQVVQNGVHAAWNVQEKLAITYCVSDNFAEFKPLALELLAEAAAAWSLRTNVKLTHVPKADRNCGWTSTATRVNVRWDLSYACRLEDGSTTYSMLPRTCPNGQPALQRPSTAGPPLPGNRTNIGITHGALIAPRESARAVFFHEVGHVLGFDHEDKQLGCTGDFYPESVALTDPDPDSIMTANCLSRVVDLSPEDHEGAGTVYGHLEPATLQSVKTVVAGGLVTDSIVVPGGRKLVVTTVGTGNADLYAGIGFPPSPSLYSARSINPAGTESVVLNIGNVPYGVDVFLARHGVTTGVSVLRANYERLINPEVLVAGLEPRSASNNKGRIQCLEASSSCSSGVQLAGRGNLLGGADASISADGCLDGNAGTYLVDESIERIVVHTSDFSALRPGVTATIRVETFAGTTSNRLTLFAKRWPTDTWAIVGSRAGVPLGRSTSTFLANLERGGPPAVRAVFTRGTGTIGALNPCPTGDFHDVDDLTFQAAPLYPGP